MLSNKFFYNIVTEWISNGLCNPLSVQIVQLPVLHRHINLQIKQTVTRMENS